MSALSIAGIAAGAGIMHLLIGVNGFAIFTVSVCAITAWNYFIGEV